MKIYYLSVTSFSDVDFELLKHLAKNHEVTYGVVIQRKNANFTTDELKSFCDDHNIVFQPFNFSYQQKDLRSIPTLMRIIAKIKKSKANLIYYASFDHVVLSMLMAMFLDKEKTLIGLHDVEFHSNAAYLKILKIARAITMRFFNSFQVFSKHQLQVFRSIYPDKHVSYIGLPVKGFGTAETKQYDPSAPTFLFFGNIIPYKGLKTLLQAFNEVIKDLAGSKKIQLVIAGRCDNWDVEYQPLILYPDHIVNKVGFIQNAEIPALFAQADYLVLPYSDATQSGPLKIAFNYNKPVIASNIPAFTEEVVNDVNGFTFDVGNVESLKQVILKCVDMSDAAYTDMRRQQAAYVYSNYSSDVLAQQINNAFDILK